MAAQEPRPSRSPSLPTHAGVQVGALLARQGVRHVFTLCGGHIAPILSGCVRAGIRVVDVRHEATAVFAADAAARLTGGLGVAAVTAGPGVTNALTALQNARQAESPVLLLGGAAPTVLKGRGALQDVDQLALVRAHVKLAASVGRVRDLVPTLGRAIRVAREGVQGPVFVECPIDLLYPEALVRSWYAREARPDAGWLARAQGWYLGRHLDGIFGASPRAEPGSAIEARVPEPPRPLVRLAARRLAAATRPVILVGAQACAEVAAAPALAAALARLGAPVYLAGAARGLLGRRHALQLRHHRKEALKAADLVLLAGVPCDFRLGYGAAIPGSASLIAVDRDLPRLFLNRIPGLPVPGDPGRFLVALADSVAPARDRWKAWIADLRARDRARDGEIDRLARGGHGPGVHPLALALGIERAAGGSATLVADGGDFVATAAYVLRPRRPLGWLDPGVFGTLGVGAGFALAACLLRPRAETWLLWGDGAAGFSLMDFDTFVRHRVPVIAVVGNDACWSQIARDQVANLGDDVATRLAPTAYHEVAQGLGAKGLLVDRPGALAGALAEAKRLARQGHPVLVNVHLAPSGFRQGSISI